MLYARVSELNLPFQSAASFLQRSSLTTLMDERLYHHTLREEERRVFRARLVELGFRRRGRGDMRRECSRQRRREHAQLAGIHTKRIGNAHAAGEWVSE